MMDLIDDWQYVLNFWFGDASDDAQVASECAGLWWGKSIDTDQLISAKFSHRIEQAGSGGLTHWLDIPEGRLAAIILLDQFRRNVFRDSAEAFAEDALALRWCREGLNEGVDALLRPIERVFFYMPLEHSESREDQAESVRLFTQLLKEVPEEAKSPFRNFLDFAEKHRDIVERFGRFPHRNAILNRESTAQELAFLEQPGSSF